MEEKIVISAARAADIFGAGDANIRKIEEKFGVVVVNRGEQLKVSGAPEAVEAAVRAIRALEVCADKGEIEEQQVNYVTASVAEKVDGYLKFLDSDCIFITSSGKPVKAKTQGQQEYVDAIGGSTVTIAVGPAGTGKTYLAVALAVRALRNKQVQRIIITRPAVEAGEKLGFLPGDLQEKVDPYLRPLNDALLEMLGGENYRRYVEKGAIEVAPLAYMRGRTLDDSFIILDEAQNTTPEQMKMFVTRFGFNSKVVITGDSTQTDLPHSAPSGLTEAVKVLGGIEGIAVRYLSSKDVVRHPLVQQIIDAYEKYEKAKARKNNK